MNKKTEELKEWSKVLRQFSAKEEALAEFADKWAVRMEDLAGEIRDDLDKIVGPEWEPFLEDFVGFVSLKNDWEPDEFLHYIEREIFKGFRAVTDEPMDQSDS